MTTAAQATRAPLTARDRCDACSAQALVRVLLASGGELQLCGHHATAHRPALLASGADLLEEQPRS